MQVKLIFFFSINTILFCVGYCIDDKEETTVFGLQSINLVPKEVPKNGEVRAEPKVII